MIDARFFIFKIKTVKKVKFDLNERHSEIVEVKDRYNTIMNQSKFMIIKTISRDNLILILRVNNLDISSKIDGRSISKFISILNEQISFNSRKNSERNRFKSYLIREISSNECREIVGTLTSEDISCNSSLDYSNFLKDLGNEKEHEITNEDDEEYQNTVLPEYVTPSLDCAINNIDSLVGYSDFKKEIHDIVKYIKLNEILNSNNENNTTPIFPFHYIFKGKREVNQFKAAVLMTEVFFHLGIIKNRKFARINIPQNANSYSGISFENIVNESDIGMVFVEDIFEPLDENINFNKVVGKIVSKMKEYRSKIIFIISCYEDNNDDHLFYKLKDILVREINYKLINFKYFNDEELLSIINCSVASKQYKISDDASSLIAFNIKNIVASKNFDLEYEIDKIIEKAIVDKKFKLMRNNSLEQSLNIEQLIMLELEDFHFLALDENEHKKEDNPIIELDEMIGLNEVKQRVRQICDFVKVKMKKKELGLKSKNICMHMEFLGNPGTGKTTVARIIGKIFKTLGFLSSGHFVEVTRENLIGPYIGQTLPKVNKAVDEAKGGVLFIDEAYSLNAHSENDYGVEAIAALVKSMEEYKDDMIFIYAGYPKEMDEMISINPGMRDRIAFKIEFPDYTSQELVEIFKKMCRDNFYVLTKEAELEVVKFMNELHNKKSEHFGNARVVRRIFERVEIFQNGRICKVSAFDKDNIHTIIEDDIIVLYEDAEISKLIKGQRLKGNIGFIM